MTHTGDPQPRPVEDDDVGGEGEPLGAAVAVGVLERIEVALAHRDQGVGPAFHRGAALAVDVVTGGGDERLLDDGRRVLVDVAPEEELVVERRDGRELTIGHGLDRLDAGLGRLALGEVVGRLHRPPQHHARLVGGERGQQLDRLGHRLGEALDVVVRARCAQASSTWEPVSRPARHASASSGHADSRPARRARRRDSANENRQAWRSKVAMLLKPSTWNWPIEA